MIFRHLNEKLKKHAIECFPEEMCGIITAGVFLALENIAEDPKKDFEIRQSDIIEYLKLGKVQAIVHSHPLTTMENPSCPSKQDMISQVSSGISWGVVDTDGVNAKDPYWWGDHLFDESLIGKEFRSGVNDCYSLIRKYYKQRKNITIPEFPRNDIWWDEGENLYIEGFEKAGFFRIDKEDLQDGDVILGKVRSSIINHGGVIINNKEDGYGLILHHLPKRLSRREPANAWINRAEIFLRHKDVT